ncbi:hypothetical protein LTR99_009410 [Exophiala xenobiotica]|uniref:Hypervirulence associated protein TUDOR domain-containing protein n=1 Tax=Vermiconidia calcicola TaxID=1690605 RepID=A0AAV9PZK7_9PEZI|nr:hypothetical protein LTR92_002237 [Exophiala xenobiotica]KAK5530915.1 hypothetical protein LTR25_008772 [Vermiconidia calcicola]KAK5544407.1 hypothetical protein LTR23_004495 [Chaetothyriales sp. CCFEE 6169]KAK5228453.1 hypothetical protein LTR72_002336 [Exophiala xenobiotica]KAK5238479.1 hypothetical protein LTR47_000222 [Exophiala xenobiotica]
MPSKDKYTDPKLREEVKEDLKQSDKGGAPGQWSARKAQMMAKEYKARGGDYNTPKENQDESQKHLSKWGEEDWQTKEGSAHAKKDDGTRKRYLPKKAWEEMSEEEKEETEQKKQEGSKAGHQFVQNTSRAKAARKNANEAEDEKYEKEKKTDQEKARSGIQTRSSTRKEQGTDETTGQPAKKDKKQKQPAKAHDGQKDDNKEEQPGHKRSRSKNDKGDEEQDSKKKQKDNSGNAKGKSKGDPKTNATVGSKHDKAEAPAAQGSISRLPTKGQTAHWKAMPGWVEGKVVEVLKARKDVEGKQVKATKDDPRIVLKSKNSGKTCVHKPDNVYFD